MEACHSVRGNVAVQTVTSHTNCLKTTLLSVKKRNAEVFLWNQKACHALVVESRRQSESNIKHTFLTSRTVASLCMWEIF